MSADEQYKLNSHKHYKEHTEYTQEALLIIKETCVILNKAANRMKQTANYIQDFSNEIIKSVKDSKEKQ